VVQDSEVGLRYAPLTTRNHQRVGTRERLLDVRQRHPGRLKIEMNALATRVLLDDRNRAVGVEYQKGERLYRAEPRPASSEGQLRRAYAGREVILAGGTFNTPQLLMLSGIGPRDQLRAHGIAVRVPLEGVGENLQDRYEVAVVNRMTFDSWDILRGATFSGNDKQYREWSDKRNGVYATNGSIACIIARSSVEQPVPDLFCYALLANFDGYFPTYSSRLPNNPNCLTWVVLKAHTNNRGGSVTLTTSNPRDTPTINFRYFEEGTDPGGDDLQAVVEGIKLVRKMTAGLKDLIDKEEVPGAALQSDEALREFVRSHAWGHHASGTCAIGATEQGGVLSSDFKVHGTERLRVVDASVFPRIPGLFIVSAVYMIGEKAADAIVAEAKRDTPPARR
jgi:choline dehydrogenase-like flavoprotein